MDTRRRLNVTLYVHCLSLSRISSSEYARIGPNVVVFSHFKNGSFMNTIRLAVKVCQAQKVCFMNTILLKVCVRHTMCVSWTQYVQKGSVRHRMCVS